MRAFVIVLLLTLLAWPSLAEAAKKRCRDAETGRFVSEKYAFWHPTTTVCERVKRK